MAKIGRDDGNGGSGMGIRNRCRGRIGNDAGVQQYAGPAAFAARPAVFDEMSVSVCGWREARIAISINDSSRADHPDCNRAHHPARS